MSSFPDYPPQRTLRVGLAVSLLFGLAVVGGVVTRCRQLSSVLDLPTHPSRISPTHTGRSRLLGWHTTEYTCRATPSEVRAWYAASLPAQGWQPLVATAGANGDRYQRGEWVIETRVAAVTEGAEVTVLATRWPPRKPTR